MIPPKKPSSELLKIQEVLSGNPQTFSSEYTILVGRLGSMPPLQACNTLREFLDSGKDCATGCPLRVGSGGKLAQVSSARVALIDLLGQVDATYARDYARRALERLENADEAAVHMRNYLWGSQRHPDAFIRQKAMDYLNHEAWIAAPTAGYLEGFDIGSFIGGEAFARQFVKLGSGERSEPVRYASFLALDRMTVREPAVVMSAVVAAGPALADRPVRRAALFSRANPADSAQVSLMEAYVAALPPASTELMHFASSFPNFDVFATDALITETRLPQRGDIIERDRQALLLLDRWTVSPPSPEIAAVLPQMRARLQEFQRSAAAGDAENVGMSLRHPAFDE